jgi:predicted transcriptional regulator of viral defense system
LSDIVSPIYIAKQLQSREQYYFEAKSLAKWFNLNSRQANRMVARLQADGLVAEVEKGKHLLIGLEPERILSNGLFIANQLVNPSYISYWSALHYHGFTTQVPQIVFCATTKKKRPVTFNDQSYRYVTIQPRKFFGYQRELVGGLPLLMADEAKAILDSLDQMRYAGGLIEVAQALQAALPRLDLELLVDYATRMADKSLASRLGYLLERLGTSASGLPVSSGPVALDPERPRRGKLDARWRIVINVDNENELFAEGVG